MPKTPLLRGLSRLFRDAHATRQTGVSLSGVAELRQENAQGERLIARRSVVGALGVGAITAALPRIASGKAQPKIVIVGGGIAGVTCALKLADRAVILDTGEVAFSGTAQEVLDNTELRHEYLAI